MKVASPGASILWLAGVAALAFMVPAVFAGLLQLPRPQFVIVHALVLGGTMAVYFASVPGPASRAILSRWPLGIAAAVVASWFLLESLARYPSSARPEGVDLALAIGGTGIVYGLVDALILNVFPVVLVWLSGVFASWPGWARLPARAVLALAASVALTVAYHLGFPEFRSLAVVQPVIGNAIITLAYLLSGSPLAPVLAHVAMHVGAVFHGMETVPQLPPHY